jgi:hypothetical protein
MLVSYISFVCEKKKDACKTALPRVQWEYLREIVITVETYVVIKIVNGKINMKNRLKLA